MKRQITIAIVLLTALALALPAFGQGPRGNRGGNGPAAAGLGGPGGFGPGPDMGGIPPRRLLERLNFTDEQYDALEALITAHRTAIEPLVEQVRSFEEQLRTELESGAPAAAVVGQLVIDIHNLRGELRDARAALHDGFLALLTEEQKTALEDFRSHRPGRGGRRGPGGPGGPGGGNNGN